MSSLEEDRAKNQALVQQLQKKYAKRTDGSDDTSDGSTSSAPSPDQTPPDQLTDWDREKVRTQKTVRAIQKKHGDSSGNKPVKISKVQAKRASELSNAKEIPASEYNDRVRKFLEERSFDIKKNVIVAGPEDDVPSATMTKEEWEKEKKEREKRGSSTKRATAKPFTIGGSSGNNSPKPLTSPSKAKSASPGLVKGAALVDPLDLDSDLPPEIMKKAQTEPEIEESEEEEEEETKPESPSPTKQFNKKDSERYLEIGRKLNSLYGADWLDWEPETIEFVLERELDLKPSKVSDGVFAIASCMSSTAPWELWNIFTNVTIALNGRIPLMDRVQAVSPGEMSVSLDIMKRIRPEQELGAELKRYIAAICHKKGLMFLTPPLNMVQGELTKLHGMKEDASEIGEFWKSIKDSNLREFPFREDTVGIQLMRLAAIDLYRKSKLDPS